MLGCKAALLKSLRHILTVGREYLTHWAIAGAVIALTGFAPDIGSQTYLVI